MQKTIGEKIKYFRTQNNIAQFDLELAIGTSYGRISKIERNRTNPTKETLHLIADYLKLNNFERSYLFGMEISNLRLDEIDQAIEETKDEIHSHLGPAYLVDYARNVYSWNQITEEIFEFSLGVISNKYPNIFKLIFDPEIYLNSNFRFKEYKDITKQMVFRFYAEVGYLEDSSLKDLIRYLKNFSLFSELWEKAKTNDLNTKAILDCFEFDLTCKQGELNFYTGTNRYSKNPKLVIVKYYPKTISTLKILKSMQ